MMLRLLFTSALFMSLNLLDVAGQSSQPVEWTGCINPGNLESEDLIKIGDQHSICLTIGPGGDWAGIPDGNGNYKGITYLRYTWRVTADQYSRFHIPNSYNDLVASPKNDDLAGASGNLTVHASAQQLVYYDKERGRIYPFLTIIVDAIDGKVQGMAWDDACVFCGKQRCLENMYNFNGNSSVELGVTQPGKGCYLAVEECNLIADAGGTDCDLTLYVVWTGTDVDGRVFSSSPNRFSAFPSSNLKEAIANRFPPLPKFNIPFV